MIENITNGKLTHEMLYFCQGWAPVWENEKKIAMSIIFNLRGTLILLNYENLIDNWVMMHFTANQRLGAIFEENKNLCQNVILVPMFLALLITSALYIFNDFPTSPNKDITTPAWAPFINLQFLSRVGNIFFLFPTILKTQKGSALLED